MLLRDGRPERTLRAAFSRDNGWTWSPTAQTSLPNPDAAVDAVRLRDGRILLAYNDASAGRDSLRLAVSTDAGSTWQPGPVLEHEPKREFSYPSIVEDARGRIHVTYTWRRERIKHVEFNAAWLDQATRTPALVQR
jgi:alpha-L-rhamnosidase